MPQEVNFQQLCDRSPPVSCPQVDFRQELKHLQEFSNYLDRSGLRGVATCPAVYRQVSLGACCHTV